MMNFYDTSSIKALVDAKQERFYSEVYQRKVALEIRKAAERNEQPNPVRRAVGLGLIRAGAWVSGSPVGDLPRLQQSA
jgi:hypothetical protein